MSTRTELEEYMVEVRDQVFSHCIERPPGGPPCAPMGKRCATELNLIRLIDLVHVVHSEKIDPYVEKFHDDVCERYSNRPTNHVLAR